MTCEFTSGHCLWGPTDQSVCCDRADGYMFSDPDFYNFDAVDTTDRKCCFVGIETDGDHECGPGVDIGTHAAAGRYCGFGCIDCDDGAGGAVAGSSKLANHHESLDGQRWLMPMSVSGRGRPSRKRAWDAHGMIHDLRSNEWWPIPGRIVYERGSCWQNDGEECFGADACVCFGDNTVDPILQHGECSPAGSPLPGRLPDEFFRTGYRWPPNPAGAGTQNIEQWYCRKFGDIRRSVSERGHTSSMVVVDPTSTPGLDNVTEGTMEPALLSSNVCQSDRMADCTGVFAKGSPCDHYSAYGECVDHPQAGVDCDTARYADAYRKFTYLSIDSNPGAGNYPHIIPSQGDRSELGGATAAWKNEILEAIRTVAFPLPREEGGAERTISFDRLDHMVGKPGWSANAGIGLFMREWIGDAGTATKVPGGEGEGRLRKAGCTFRYATFITRVKIVCRLILQQQVDPENDYVKSIMPLVRYHIIANAGMLIGNVGRRGAPHGQCTIDTHVADGISVGVANRFHEDGRLIPIVQTSPNDEQYANTESFMFFGADGRQFIPSPFVEWRGFLGGHSKPTADDQAATTPGGTCEEIAARFYTLVPGWPTHVDSPVGPNNDDPAGIYGGHVIIQFAPQELES